MQMNIGWRARFFDAIPYAFGAVRVMVPRNQVPRDVGELSHALERFEQRPRRWRFSVVDVAGHQDMRSILLLRQLTNLRNDGETSLPQYFFPVAKLLKRLTDLPVCGVNDAHKLTLQITEERLEIVSPRCVLAD